MDNPQHSLDAVAITRGEFRLKPYLVAVQGFGEFAYPAATRGKALAEAWRSFTSSYDAATFRDFLGIAKVRRSPDLGGRFGEPITVAGEPAFYVGERGQYVRFVRPDSDIILLAHPADVAAVPPTEAPQSPRFQ